MAAGEARGRRHRGGDRVVELEGRGQLGTAARRRTISPAIRSAKRSSPYSRSMRASRRRSHVLTISAAVSSWLGVHPHVQRRVVGVGEAALAGVDLHRAHAEVHVDEVGAHALVEQLLQPGREVGADEAGLAGDLGGSARSNACCAVGSRSMRDQRSRRDRGGRRRAARGRRRRACSRSRSGPAAGRAPRSARRRGPGRASGACQAGWPSDSVRSGARAVRSVS